MLQQYAYIAEMIGVVAIVVTLIYLAIQTKQNTEAVQATTRHTVIANDLMVIQAMLDHPEAISFCALEGELSLEQKIQLEGWLIALARTREHHWLQYESNLLDSKTMESFLTGLTINLSYPRTRAWWNRVSRLYFDADFVDYVNRRLAAIPVDENYVHPID